MANSDPADKQCPDLRDSDILEAMKAYFEKMTGTTVSPPRVSLSEIAWSWLGAFLGIGFISFANYQVFEKIDLLMIVGSFGASAVLIYGAIKSPWHNRGTFSAGTCCRRSSAWPASRSFMPFPGSPPRWLFRRR